MRDTSFLLRRAARILRPRRFPSTCATFPSGSRPAPLPVRPQGLEDFVFSKYVPAVVLVLAGLAALPPEATAQS